MLHIACGRLMCARKKKAPRRAAPCPIRPKTAVSTPNKEAAVVKKVEKRPMPPANVIRTSVRRPDSQMEMNKSPLQTTKTSTTKSASTGPPKSDKKESSDVLVPNDTMRSMTATAALPEPIEIAPPRIMTVQRTVDGNRDPLDPEYRTLQVENGEWDSAELMSRLELKGTAEKHVDSEKSK